MPSITRTTLFTAISDLFMLVAIMSLCLGVRYLFGGQINLKMYDAIFLSLLLAIPIYAAVGLYPPMLLSSPEILRRFTYGTTFFFLVIFALTFFFRNAENYSRLALFCAWALAVALMPVWRGVIKRKFSTYAWWGKGIVLCGSREWLEKAVQHLAGETALGLKPCAVMITDEDAEQSPPPAEMVFDLCLNPGKRLSVKLPVIGIENLPEASVKFNSPYALMNLHSLSPKAREEMAKLAGNFKKTFFVFSFLGNLNCWGGMVDLHGELALETRQKLLDAHRQCAKRLIDLLLSFLGAFVFIPATLVIALLIKKEDGGPVFYGHTRIGRGGEAIKILKFRTMVMNADKVLKDYLAKDPALAKEWEENHKLRNDPRITRIGRFLRKTSLDELPQVWNVVKGELSFVGPRPIVEDEIRKYGEDGFELYKKVLPGLTGYWQVSGRSNTSYEKRVALDSFYIRNWSVWLDIYIIACTPRALLRTEDAC